MKKEKIKFKLKERLKAVVFSKKIKYNSLITIFIIVFIAIIFVLNLLVFTLVSRYDIKIDLSANGLYKISDETKNFLSEYDKKVRLTLLNNEDSLKKSDNIYGTHLYNIVKNIASCSDNISLEYIDLQERPSFISKYPGLNLEQNGVLITDEKNNAQFLPISKLFQRQYETMEGLSDVEVVSNVEKNIAHSLEFLSGQDKMKILSLNGHDEIDLNKVKGNVFEENGYQLVDFNLLTTKIPEDSDLIFIVAPKIDYKEEEIKKLEEFSNKGKKIVYFASATQPKLPSLEEFIRKNSGISLDEGIVVETDPNKMSPASINNIFVQVSYDNEYLEDFTNKKLPININDLRPIRIDEKQKDLEVVTICETNSSSAVLKDEREFNIEEVEKKSFPVAVSAIKKLGENKKASMLVFSSAYMLGAIDIPQLGNGEFILSVLGKVAEHKSKIHILPKVIGLPRLAITKTVASIIGVLFILILPFVVILIGAFIYIKRRRI